MFKLIRLQDVITIIYALYDTNIDEYEYNIIIYSLYILTIRIKRTDELKNETR